MPYSLARRAAAVSEELRRDREWLGSHPLPHTPLAGMHAHGAGAHEIACGEDPISCPYSVTAAAVAPRSKQALGHFAQRVSSGATTTGSGDMSSSTLPSCSYVSWSKANRLDVDSSSASRSSSTSRGTAPDGGSPRLAGSSVPTSDARNGARWWPTIFAGGHQSGSYEATGSCSGLSAELAAEIARLSSRQKQPTEHRLKAL